MRPAAILLGILLAAAAATALLDLPDVDTLPPLDAVRLESASPLRWADLGDSLRDTGQLDQARQAYRRALELAPGIPQVWVRAANFNFQTGDPRQGLRCGIQALHLVDAYDDILFAYFDRLAPGPSVILNEIGNDHRAAHAYTEHLIASGSIDAAQYAWNRLQLKDQRLKNSYIDALLNAHRYQAAQALGCPALCNGSFETEPTGSILDWRIQPSTEFDTTRDNSTAHDGKWSLRLEFHAQDNVSYANLAQTAIVRPGPHHLRAWIRSDNITTNEGPRLAVLNAQTDPITGTHDWTPIDLSFTVPSNTNLIQIRLVRTPSLKLDNKIAGTFWLDSVTLQ